MKTRFHISCEFSLKSHTGEFKLILNEKILCTCQTAFASPFFSCCLNWLKKLARTLFESTTQDSPNVVFRQLFTYVLTPSGNFPFASIKNLLMFFITSVCLLVYCSFSRCIECCMMFLQKARFSSNEKVFKWNEMYQLHWQGGLKHFRRRIASTFT